MTEDSPKVQAAKDAFDELGKINPGLAYRTAKKLLNQPESVGQTPEEFMEDIRRRSPAVAFAQDMGILPGVSQHDPIEDLPDLRVPGEVIAAIKTNRWELLRPLRNRIEAGEVLSEEAAQGMHMVLERFYKTNAQEPILSELLKALEPVEEALTAQGGPTVETSLILLDKLKAVLQTINHRQEEYADGVVPASEIPDGPSRVSAFRN